MNSLGLTAILTCVLNGNDVSNDWLARSILDRKLDFAVLDALTQLEIGVSIRTGQTETDENERCNEWR